MSCEQNDLARWADVIVVGAGASGSVVAARLAEAQPDWHILVMELGPDNFGDKHIELPGEDTKLWNHPDGPNPTPSHLHFVTTPQRRRTYVYPRGNGPGGSTNHHNLVDGKGSGLVYDRIAAHVNDTRWMYQNVLPFFKRMENYSSLSAGAVSVVANVFHRVKNFFNASDVQSQGKATEGDQSIKDCKCPSSGETTGSTCWHGHKGWLRIQHKPLQMPIQLAFAEAAQEVLGVPFQSDRFGNPRNAVGVGPAELQVNADGKRCYAYKDLLVPVMKRNKNIIVLLQSLVTRVLLRAKVGNSTPRSAQNLWRAEGVEVMHGEAVYRVDYTGKSCAASVPSVLRTYYARREVILSGGAINTPQILQLSGLGDRSHLRSLNIPVRVHLPKVGANVLDHHEVAINYEVDRSKTIWPSQARDALDNVRKAKAGGACRYDVASLEPLLKRFALPESIAKSATEMSMICDCHSGVDTVMPAQQSALPYFGPLTQISRARLLLHQNPNRQLELARRPHVLPRRGGSRSNEDCVQRSFYEPDLHIHSNDGFFFDFDLDDQILLPDGNRRRHYMDSQFHPERTGISGFRVFQHFLLECLHISRADGFVRISTKDPREPPHVNLSLHTDDEAAERMARGILMIRNTVMHPKLKQYYKLDCCGRPHEIFPGYHIQTLDELKRYLKDWSAFGHHIGGTAQMGPRSDSERTESVVNSSLQVHGVDCLRVVDTSVYPHPYLHPYNTSRGAYLIGEIGANMILASHQSQPCHARDTRTV